MDPARYLDLFLSESREQLTRAYAQIARLERFPDDAETLRALRRHVHSLKGMGATMGNAPLVRLAHALEDEFERAQDAGGNACDLGRVQDALTRLGQLIDGVEREYADREPVSEAESARRYRIDLRLIATAARQASRTVAALRRLGRLGFVESVSPPLLAGSPPRFDGRLSLRLRFSGAAADLHARLARLDDVESFELTEVPARIRPRRPATAPASWTQVRSDRLDAAAERALELLAEHRRLRSAAGSDPTVREALARLESRAKELFGTITQMRMLPFSSIVQRLQQAAGELSLELRKPLRLIIEGAEVQLERSMLDALYDPLQHLLRNAVDHGIESPDERRAAGKPPRATLTLRLVRRGSRVAISFEDDGRGLEPDRLRRAAVERGLLSAGRAARMSDDEARMLISRPSFSTASKISRISGRGIGMDVVREAVEGMGGELNLHSPPGGGTRIEIALPRARALIQTLVVRSAGQLFALPLSYVSRVRRTHASPRAGAGRARPPVRLRIDAHDGPCPDDARSQRERAKLQLELDGGAIALVVDEIVGRRQIVVRPFERPLDRLRSYAGAGVLEDGGIVLVLDPYGFGSAARQSM